MPVNHNLRVIFIHIPKTAGTSVEYALGMHCNEKKIGLEEYQNQVPNYKNLFGNNLQHYDVIKIQKFLGKEKYESYFKFSIVRNPFDRLVSFVAWRDRIWKNSGSLPIDNFRNYLRMSQKLFSWNKTKLPKPQYEYIYYRKKKLVDLILHYENLQVEINKLHSHLDIEIKLDERMKSNHLYYKFYYDDYCKNLVKKFYKKDFELFGYNAEEI